MGKYMLRNGLICNGEEGNMRKKWYGEMFGR
jgi:hypothetical protein